MKSILIILISLSSIQGFAQSTSLSSSQSTSQSSRTSIPATSTTTNTESVSSSTQSVAPAPSDVSPWGFSYFNLAISDAQTANYGGASWNMYQYFQTAYKANRTERYTLRYAYNTQTSGFNRFGQTQESKTTAADLHATYSNFALAKFTDWNLSGTFYAYAPTSESSIEKKWTARVSSWLIFENKLDRNWTLTYNSKPDYYFNTQKAYRSERETTLPDGTKIVSAKAQNNMIGKYDHYFEISRYLNKTFTPSANIGVVHEWYYPSEQANTKDSVVENFKLSLGSWVYVNSNLKFIVAADNRIDLRDRRGNEAQLFRESEIGYTIFTFWTIL
jgi:hypothetical protein